MNKLSREDKWVGLVMEGIEEMGRAVEVLASFGGYAEKILLILPSSHFIGCLEFS